MLLFLEHASKLKISFSGDTDMQTNFDNIYAIMRDLPNRFYPERTLATPQRELTRENQTVRFNVILLMRYGLNTRTR